MEVDGLPVRIVTRPESATVGIELPEEGGGEASEKERSRKVGWKRTSSEKTRL